MICPKCGTNNNDGSSFCIRCGANLIENNMTPQPNNNIQNNEYLEQPINQPMNNQTVQPQMNPLSYQQPKINQVQQPINSVNNTQLDYFNYMFNAFLKPVECFKKEENKFNDTKTSIIFSSIIAVIIMIINLIKTMISAILTKSFDYTTFKTKTTIDFSKLKDLNYLDLIGKQLLIYAGIILVIALVYYLASLVIKKQTSFTKMLAISATSVMPFVILGMVISPILGKIWTPLSIISLVIGVVYSLLIFITLINKDITFDNEDKKIYFNLVCLSILGSALYYVYIKLLISSKVSDLLDFFG